MNNTAADARFTGEKTTPTFIPICLLLPAPWPFALLMLNVFPPSPPSLSLPRPHNAASPLSVLPCPTPLHHLPVDFFHYQIQ